MPAPSNIVEDTGLLYTGVLYMVTHAQSRAFDAAKKGSADLLILALVEEQALHGYEIGRRIEERSGGALRFTLASLYETLYRLDERGWIRGRWVERSGQRRRRCYRITDAGRRVLAGQREDWARFIAAIAQVAGVKPA